MRARSKALWITALATAVGALMALPAMSSAAGTWVDSGGMPLGSFSPNGASGYDDRATANVSGRLDVAWSGSPGNIDLNCSWTGAIELWNDGVDWAPGKYQIVSLDTSSCSGYAGPICQLADASANNLPWGGDLTSWWQTNFTGVNITYSWTTSGCWGNFPVTGTLQADLSFDSNGCVVSLDPSGTLSSDLGPVTVDGSLEVQSIDGLYFDDDCVIPFE